MDIEYLHPLLSILHLESDSLVDMPTRLRLAKRLSGLLSHLMKPWQSLYFTNLVPLPTAMLLACTTIGFDQSDLHQSANDGMFSNSDHSSRGRVSQFENDYP
jgi:hypothetical protein